MAKFDIKLKTIFMKKLLALGLGLFAAGYVNAQSLKISNTSCDPVDFILYGDEEACDNWAFFSTTYTINPGSVLYFDMMPGGSYTPVNWIYGNTPAAGNYFSSIKVFGAGNTWADYMITECLGKTTFTQKGSCVINGKWIQDTSDPTSATVLIY